MTKRKHPPCRAVVAAAIAVAASGIAVAQQDAAAERSLPMTASGGFETVKLGTGERMGLARGEVLFELAPGWWTGPAVYGAASGRRGGFFVGGVELQRRWAFDGRTSLAAGLYAGGGGGGNAPVGSGLMLRPALTLWRDVGGVKLGVSASAVRFPGGNIRSRQLGVALAWDGRFIYFDPEPAGRQVATSQRSGLGFDRFELVVTRYKPHADAVSGPAPAAIDLVGARAERRLGGPWWAGVEAAGAARGGAGGYAEVFGTLGWEQAGDALGLPRWSAGLRAAAGLGGGGAVRTGGGVMGKAAARLAWQPAPGYSIALEQGVAAAADGDFRARETRLLLGLALDRPELGSASATVVRNEAALAVQHVASAQRKSGPARALDTLGVRYDRYIGDNLYLTGQGHSAYSGGAGAYSVGLVGLGAAASSARLRYGAELLVGASGGGGVDTHGGAIAQAMTRLGWRITPEGTLALGAGRVRSLRGGGLDSAVLEVSWSQAFGLTRR